MARKKKKPKRSAQRQVIPFTPRAASGIGTRFTRGQPVRVKAGVHDPDFPELDLSGWTGTILDVEADSLHVNCEVAWTADTLRRIDSDFRDRCDEEGLAFDSIWLYESDLEPDLGRPVQELGPLAMPGYRPPVGLVEQENRIRAALGVPVGAEIPIVTGPSLLTYQRYLTTRLVFPLACHDVAVDDADGRTAAVTLTGIMEYTDDPRFGLVAEILRAGQKDFVPLSTLSVDEPQEAHQIVEDYAFWFWSRLSLEPEAVGALLTPGGVHPIWSTIKATAAYGAGCGATTGALLVTDPNSQYGMWVGIVVLGLGGFLAGTRFGRMLGTFNGIRFGPLYGAFFGTLAGMLVGTAGGVMLVGALGTIPGAILGSLIGSFLAARNWEPIGRNSWAPLGACIGGLVLAALHERERAFTGALVGAGTGALLAALVVMLLLVSVGLASREQRR